MNDDAIRDVLSPLRGNDPRPDVEGLVTRGRRAQVDRRRRRGLVLGAATALAAGVVAASLPAGEEPLTARSVLNAAAAAAADQPPEKLTGIRYVKIDYRILLQPDDGGQQYQFTRTLEYWVRRDASTHAELSAGSFSYLDGREHARPGPMPPVEAASSDERRMGFEHLDVAGLSTDPAQARAEIETAVRRTFDERMHEPLREEIVPQLVVRSAIDLLSYASITREQRRALFQVLADQPSARVVGRDAVEFESEGFSGSGRTIRTTVVVDPDTGALRTRSERPGAEPYIDAERVEETATFVVSRDVDSVGERP